MQARRHAGGAYAVLLLASTPAMVAVLGAEAVCLSQVGYSLLGAVYHLLEQHHAKRIDEAHLPDATVILYLRVAADSQNSLNTALLDATSGQVSLEEIEV